MSAWKLAPALEQLRKQINEAYPNRLKVSDGTIGDARHAASVSDHNPDSTGLVRAMDITHDPSVGLSADFLSDVLYDSRDRRISYIIANRLITTPSGTGSGNYGPWTRYTGSNPHTTHVHISVLPGSYANDASEWNLPRFPKKAKPNPVVKPPKLNVKLHQGMAVPNLIRRGTGHYFGSISGPVKSHGGYVASEKPLVKILQQRLIVCGFVPGITDPNSNWADGIFDLPSSIPGTGPTSQAVKRFQGKYMPGTTFFGQVWWDDWTKLFNL